MKLSYLIIIFFISLSAHIYSQGTITLRTEITPELAKEYDQYITKYAPADSAYNLLISWANTHYFHRRAAVSLYLLELYGNKFPQKRQLLMKEISNLEQVMISQSATFDMIPIYKAYVENKAPNDEAFFALQRIADYYISNKLWDSAAVLYKNYQSKFPVYKVLINKIIDLINSPVYGLQIENLGPNINTRGSEWDPTPTPDGRYLYFSADHRRGGLGNSDIWVSENIDGIWQKSTNINKPINGIKDETVDNVTVDGNGLLLSGNFEGSYGLFDIYLANKDENGWSDLIHFPAPINTEYHDESGSLSPDGKALLFTSDRPGGIGPFVQMNSRFFGGTVMGNMDIYVCLLSDSGWSAPINLGPMINTPYTERSVYLHPDGKTLYFSSNGHYGLGRMDVFKSVRLSDTSWTDWSPPVNLGKEINTINDDWGYVIDLEGNIAYFAKENDPDGNGMWDIYSITLPDVAKPQPFAIIRGIVKDNNEIPLACNIIWEDLETGKKVGQLRSDPKDGHYFITLPLGKNYGYYAEKSNYYPASKNIDLRNVNNKIDLNEDITLVSILEMQNTGAKIRVNNLFFDFDKSELKDESLPELERLLKFVQKVNKYKIVIEGHTDDLGTAKHNITLSQKRAESVANHLISKGVDKNRIRSNGFGSSKPAIENTNDNNRSLNRRVEIRLERE